jgi:hypothetical protein
MAFMIPVAEKLAAYHVETENGVEIVPETVCGSIALRPDGLCPVCGESVTLQGRTSDGRRYASCGDAFTEARWREDDNGNGATKEDAAKLRPYLDGAHVHGFEKREGWYGRLSDSRYTTEWHGPHDTADAALDAIKELYECDDAGHRQAR